MNKRKILMMALALCMVAIIAVGGTLAYFTDNDNADNVFTIGNIDITLNETFDEENALLVPNIDIEKDVTITLEDGSVDAYVWYTYAIPAVLDNLNNAGENIVHVNHAGQNWDDYFTEDNANGYEGTASSEDDTWDVDYLKAENAYTDENGIVYNVYTTLYHGVLSAGETTTLGMTKVYLDSRVDTLKEVDENGKTVVVPNKYTFKGEEIDYDFSQNVHIIVNAYGIQADGLTDVNKDGTVDVYDAYLLYNAQVEAN